MNDLLTPTSARLCVGALAVVVVGLGACSSNAPPDADTGMPRDATVVDSTLTNDAASDASAPASDTGTALDGAAPSCGGGCDPVAHMACGPDMSCRFVSGIPVCTAPPGPDAGSGTDGSACAYDTDCAPGLACFGVGGLGTCGRVCCETRADCATTERCRGDGLLAGGTTTSWGRCLPPVSCDLAHPEHACAPREGCYIVDGAGTTECLLAGNVAPGAPCTEVADCAPGNVCTGLTARTCVAICFLTSTAPHQGCGDTEHCAAQAYSPAGTGICTSS